MADLNALIAQGAQFNMPDRLGQYAKMQQLQAGQQQMRTGALQEQTAGMQLQKLQEDRANMAALSQKLSVKGVTPRQYFEALQTSGDPQHQQLGIEGLIKLDQTEKYDKFLQSQQTTPAQQPPAMSGALGSGTFGMGQPAPANALAPQAAAPMAADPVAAIDSQIAQIRNFADPRAKDELSRLQKQRDELARVHSVGGSLMTGTGRLVGTAPVAPAAPVLPVPPDVEAQRIRIALASRPPSAPAAPKEDKAPSGYRFTKTGELEAIPGGPAAKVKEPTVAEQNATYNINRVLNAATEIKNITAKDPNALAPGAAEATARSMGAEGAANVARSSNRQIVYGAQRDALDALLYLATGAAYNKEQLQGAWDSYMPAYTDDTATKTAKQARLGTLLEDAKTRAGKAWTPKMESAMQALISPSASSAVSGKVAPAAPNIDALLNKYK